MVPTPTLNASAVSALTPALTPIGPIGLVDLDSPPIDSEAAALLRCILRPLIARSPSWEALEQALARRGYALAFRNGRLCLTRAPDGPCICSMRYLGAGLRELSARLGRPAVRPLPGHPAAGVLCSRPRG